MFASICSINSGSSAEALVSSSYGSAVYGHKVDGTLSQHLFIWHVAARCYPSHGLRLFLEADAQQCDTKLILPAATTNAQAAVAYGRVRDGWLYKDALKRHAPGCAWSVTLWRALTRTCLTRWKRAA